MNGEVGCWRSEPSVQIGGEGVVAGDKSISHRAVFLGLLAYGETVVKGLLEGDDVIATLRVAEKLGALVDRRVEQHTGVVSWHIQGTGL